MNDIPVRQNLPDSLKLMRARQEMFHRAKLVFIAQLVLTVLLPVIGAVAGLFMEQLRSTVAFFSLLVTILDITVLDRAQRRFVRNGAKIAECFDCAVLRLPWNTLSAGKRPDPEMIDSVAEAWSRRHEDKGIIDWYPTEAGETSLEAGRLLCQRSSLWYDATLRRFNGSIALGLSWLIPSAFLTACWWTRLPLSEFAVTCMPVAPVLVWSVREHFRQKDTAESQDQTKAELEGFLSRVEAGAMSLDEAEEAARSVQNALYARRVSSPLVMPGLYELRRAYLERTMKAGVAARVRDAGSSA
ncbi:S-4TM family putative pore-forming effector [Brevundimonas aurantiaca]|jgi:hypothetical protein|uniref:S-4TM family putative pore-forming effector n=1 Tax=Brevundimonas aurantiaca TaxID=74316 RepID=UPI0016003BD7|nr:hypothetical protein [Pseudomonas sp. FW305-3-2-15-E-TSA4]